MLDNYLAQTYDAADCFGGVVPYWVPKGVIPPLHEAWHALTDMPPLLAVFQ